MEEDPFVSIIKFCRPTPSQEAKFLNCPLARNSENFADSDLDQFSSPDPTPTVPTAIVMISPPGSSGSVHQHVEDEFHTPPEHHPQSHLSSEDQNLNEGVDEVEGPDRRKKARPFEVGLDDEPEAKKFRVMEEKYDGETVPVDETEAIDMKGSEGVHDTMVVVSVSEDSGEEIAPVNLGDDSLVITSKDDIEVDSVDVVRKIGKLIKDSIPKVDAVNGNHELAKECESLEDTALNKGEMSDENSDLSRSIDSGNMDEEISKLKCIVGNRCTEVREKSGVGGSEKVAGIAKEAKMPKECYRNGCLKTDGKRTEEISLKTDGKRIVEIGVKMDGKRTEEIGLKMDGNRTEEMKANGKRIEEIDKFRYSGDSGRAVGGSHRSRQLPVSLKGKEKEVETKSGLLGFLDVLMTAVGDTDDGCEDVDFLETIKRRGFTFPKPRWWPSERDGVNGFM